MHYCRYVLDPAKNKYLHEYQSPVSIQLVHSCQGSGTHVLSSMVSRISVIVVVTGTLTCIVVVASMVTFLAYPMSACEYLGNPHRVQRSNTNSNHDCYLLRRSSILVDYAFHTSVP